MTKNISIQKASFHLLYDTPGHSTFGIWVNGGKCGDLTVRREEATALRERLLLAGFIDLSTPTAEGATRRQVYTKGNWITTEEST